MSDNPFRKLPSVTLVGIFTHLPFATAESVPWVQERLQAFGKVARAIQDGAGRPLVSQALASSGLALGLEAPARSRMPTADDEPSPTITLDALVGALFREELRLA